LRPSYPDPRRLKPPRGQNFQSPRERRYLAVTRSPRSASRSARRMSPGAVV
jgi:hypothetical protein